MNNSTKFLTGIGIGAGLMFLADPGRGRRRRAIARDKFYHYLHEAADAIDVTRRDLIHRVRGIAAETTSRMHSEQVDDDVLVARVRSRLGRIVSHPHAITVTADDGTVCLSGPVLADEYCRLLRSVQQVRGVTCIEDDLDVHSEDENLPALQGGVERRGQRFELLQDNWSPAARLVAGALGGILAAYAARSHGVGSKVLAPLGLALLTRSISNHQLRDLIGAGNGHSVSIQKTIRINAPVDEVFGFWLQLENFPRFMSHLKEVEDLGGGYSRWVASGPAGVPVEWKAQITRMISNELLSWHSLPGSAVDTAGLVHFERENGGTRLHVQMAYTPPAGAVGHVVAKLFGADARKALDDDLVRLKSLIEEGKTRAHGEKVHLEDVARLRRPHAHQHN